MVSNLYDKLKKNEKCYLFKHMTNTDGIFNKTIDATYVVHLEGNGRHESVIKQLNEYHLTNDVYILYNKGFKKCKKTDNIIYPADDLTDAFFQIFKHANETNYENILILEDDFILDSKIKNINHVNNINDFLIKKKDKSFIYFLGCVPFLSFPSIYMKNTYNVLSSIGTHSVIYSKKYRENLIRDYNKINKKDYMKDWDSINNLYSVNKFMYYTPICYQLFPETDNKKSWGGSSTLSKISGYFAKAIIYVLGLYKNIEPGYSIIYTISKILPIILLILFIAIIYMICVIFSKYINKNKKVYKVRKQYSRQSIF
jgi:hypothetical protein